jgi:hypothetical protein
VIALETAKSYVWTKPIRSDRRIVLRGATGQPATVIVERGAAAVFAPEVVLENVRLLRANPQSGRGNDSALLTVESDRLWIERGEFLATGSGPAIEWHSRTAASRTTELALKDCVIAGGRVAVHLRTAPSSIRAENVLHLGPGVLWRIAEMPPRGRTISISLAHVTQRNATALLHVDVPPRSGSAGRAVVSAKNCVFHYAGADSALCVFGTSFPGQLPPGMVQFSGEGSLFPPGGRIAVESAVGPASAARVDNDAVQIDGGLLACEFEFTGPAGSDPATSVIAKHRAPVRSQHTPGIDARRLLSIRP